jgi:hypothetical protein
VPPIRQGEFLKSVQSLDTAPRSEKSITVRVAVYVKPAGTPPLPRTRCPMKFAAAVLTLALLSTSAHAALVERLGGLAYYDDVLDITWLADANYARTSGFDDDGRMTWDQAMHWAENLVFQGYDDWRVPTLFPVDGAVLSADRFSTNGTTDFGYGATGLGWVNSSGAIASEMGWMYYANLGNLGRCSPGNNSVCLEPPNFGLKNVGPFVGIADAPYWTNQNYNDSSAWVFEFAGGSQGPISKNATDPNYAWAVRDGDVGLAPIPIPAAVYLFGSALAGLGMLRPKRTKQASRLCRSVRAYPASLHHRQDSSTYSN